MSDPRPMYIACASGTQPQADFRIERHGDLVKITGHPFLLLTPQDAILAIKTAQAVVDAIEAEKPPESAPDPVVDKVREKLLQRSRAGIQKYGTTMMREDLTRRQWLQQTRMEDDGK